MRSNGFGRVKQRILVHVPREHTRLVANKLGATPVDVRGSDPTRAYLEWTRHSVRTNDDEDVVFYLALLLRDGDEQIGWKIDWQLSAY